MRTIKIDVVWDHQNGSQGFIGIKWDLITVGIFLGCFRDFVGTLLGLRWDFEHNHVEYQSYKRF